MGYNEKVSYLIGKNKKLNECNKVELQHILDHFHHLA